MKMTHIEKLLSALYVSESWHVFALEHKNVSFKTRSLIAFDRAILCVTWEQAKSISARGQA
jgi:hypothetical protein